MKGNRLNTAANTGTFVTSRQQLQVQKQIAGDTSALLALQMRQAEQAENDRMVAHYDKAVASGQMTTEEADAQMGLITYNRKNPAPRPKMRISATVSSAVDGLMGFGVNSAGWYKQNAVTSRYWDGNQWTLQTMPLMQAKQNAKHEWANAPVVAGAQKSRKVAGLLGIFLGALGIHRFYLGNKGVGLVQMLLLVFLGVSTFGLVALWGITEGIMILSHARAFDRDAHGVPLADSTGRLPEATMPTED